MDEQDYYFEEAGLILCNTGQKWKGKGDGLTRTAQFAMFKGRFDWLRNVRDLLKRRRRWPEELDDPRGVEFEHRKPYGFGSMTWDPLCMFYCASWIMDKKEYIKEVKPPWYNWRPPRNWWYRYLRSNCKSKFWKWMWETAEITSLKFKPPAFALYLSAWQAYVGDSDRIKKKLIKLVPHWNYCVKQLIHHPLRHLDRPFILAFTPGEGMIWQAETWNSSTRRLLPEGQDLYLDQSALFFVLTRNLMEK